MSRITVEDFNGIIHAELPWAEAMGMRAQSIADGRAVLRVPFSDNMLRPGGTVSGPAMMALADAAMYAAVLSAVGAVKLAVTTNFNINFLRRPEPADLTATATLLKLGKRLAVLEVAIEAVGTDHLLAHATGTYSLPPLP